MTLTDEEREKFIQYLEIDAESSEGIARQMENTHVPEVLVKQIKAEAIAFRIVAKKLRQLESFNVGR